MVITTHQNLSAGNCFEPPLAINITATPEVKEIWMTHKPMDWCFMRMLPGDNSRKALTWPPMGGTSVVSLRSTQCRKRMESLDGRAGSRPMTAERLSTRVNSKELLKSSECHIGTDGILITMSSHLSSIFQSWRLSISDHLSNRSLQKICTK